MTTTISSANATILPDQVLGYRSDRSPTTVVHEIIGRAEPDVTLRPAGTASGSLRLRFAAETAAHDAQTALSSTDVFTLVSTDLSTIDMTFVVVEDSITRELDMPSDEWNVTFAYRQVATS